MSSHDAVLFGLIAFDAGHLTVQQFTELLHAVRADREHASPELLVQRGLLPDSQFAELEHQVATAMTNGSVATLQQHVLQRLPLELQRLVHDVEIEIPHSIQEAMPTPSAGDFSSVNLASMGESPEMTMAESAVPPRQTGRYRVIRAHKEGGLGRVSVAIDLEVPREVAFKEIKDRFKADRRARLRFLREAEITGSLEHPGIVPVYGLGTFPDGRPFYAMRFIRGKTLLESARLFHEARRSDRASSASSRRSGGKAQSHSRLWQSDVEFRELLNRFLDVCDAIEYAHSHKIIHRDLKPDNVMLGEYGETLVVDWGLARKTGDPESVASRDPAEAKNQSAGAEAFSQDSETQAGVVLGTPAYMSPEQATGKTDEVSFASDVYSLGATLYQLLTGMAPIGARPLPEVPEKLTREEVILRAAKGLFPPPSEINPHVPAALNAICLKAMAMNPRERYGSARALASDLEHWLADEPVSVFPEGLWEHLRRWARNHRPLVASLTVGAGVSLLLLTILIVTQSAANSQLELANTTLAGVNLKLRSTNAQLEEVNHRLDDSYQQVRQSYYLSQMRLCQRDWSNGDRNHLEEHLAMTAPERTDGSDLRGFEWYFWDRQLKSGKLPLQGHTGDIKSVSFSPDARTIVTASGDGTARLWNVQTGQVRLVLAGHRGDVNGAVWSLDGKWIATASEDQTIRLWNAMTGEAGQVLQGHTNSAVCLAFNQDASRLISGGRDKTIRVWETATGRELRVLSGHAGWIHGVAFHPDGIRAASCGADWTVRFWNTQTGETLWTQRDHTDEVNGVAFDTEGLSLVSASDDRSLRVRRIEDGTAVRTLSGHDGAVYGARFSPDGQKIASGSMDRTIRLWNTDDGQPLMMLKGHAGEIHGLDFSRDGHWLASASWDQSARIWSVDNGELLRTCDGHHPDGIPVEAASFEGHASWVLCADISRDGQWVASGSKDETIRLWNAETRQQILSQQAHTGGVYWVAFHPDGHLLASGGRDNNVKLWDVSSGQLLRTMSGHEGWVYCVAWDSAGKRLASASADQTSRVWDAATGELLQTLRGHSSEVNSVAFTSDGNRVVSVSDDRTARVTVIETGQTAMTFTGHSAPIFGVACHPESGLVATASQDETVFLWDAETGTVIRPLRGHVDDVNGVRFSHDGARVVSAGDDHTVRVWDTASGQEVLTLRGHAAMVRMAAFSHDDRALVSAGWDGRVRLWQSGPLVSNANAATSR